MDDRWLTSLENTSCVLVPTRSLQSDLHARVAHYYLGIGKSVWESPTIITWADYLNTLWLANRNKLSQANSVINADQSRLLWERVIEQTKRAQDDLTLLNVPQTARAAHRSWQLASDWQLDIPALAASAVADTRQFGKWCESYQALLSEQRLLDQATLFMNLCALASGNQLQTKFNHLVWHGFDLTTTAQSVWRELGSDCGIEHSEQAVEPQDPQIAYSCYPNSNAELHGVLNKARQLVENQATLRINIVVPDMQQRQAQVSALAANVFYPSWAPLDLLNNDLVYRFSLGRPLAEWGAITAALKLLNTLTGHVAVTDFTWLLRNRYLRIPRELQPAIQELEQWLQQRRINQLKLVNLPTLIAEAGFDPESKLAEFANQVSQFLQQLQHELTTAAEQNRYRTLKPTRWRELFNQWLVIWGWSTATSSDSLSSVQYQLLERWQGLLASFEGLSNVQYRSGLRRALELLQRLAREQVFLPKAAAAPIYISGVFEAIGMPSDICFVTGMNDQFPAAARLDPFIANQLHESRDYPSATPTKHLAQARKVLDTLLHSAKHCEVSFAQQDSKDASITRGVSSLFRHSTFLEHPSPLISRRSVELDRFIDTHAPPVSEPLALRGGTRIFTNQSNCAFRAFASHRLQCSGEDEAEFGLDAAERGNMVHLLLEKCWQRIQSQTELKAILAGQHHSDFIDAVVTDAINTFGETLEADKQRLLHLERRRLGSLLLEWLMVEAKRPTEFAVAGTEEGGEHIVGGIHFNYKIDRIDFTDSGDTVVIDYKTGNVNRADLHGDRLREPQLPLYVQAITAKKNKAPVGVALAQIKSHNCSFTELSEAAIFARQAKTAERYAEQWAEAHEAWPSQLEALANDFLNGHAEVNPIDEKTCLYCDFKSLCRINQLRSGGEMELEEHGE